MFDSFETPRTLNHHAVLSMGLSQARILEWVAISYSRGSSWTRDQSVSSGLAIWFFTTEPPGKPNNKLHKINWEYGEPGGLPSMGSHRVRHDWSDLAAAVPPERLRLKKNGDGAGQEHRILFLKNVSSQCITSGGTCHFVSLVVIFTKFLPLQNTNISV